MFYLEPLAGKCQLTQKPDTELDINVLAFAVLKMISPLEKDSQVMLFLKQKKPPRVSATAGQKCPHRTIQ